jgi:hypothetical protein
MATMYCALCGRPVEARRQIGAGTVLLAMVSFGLSLLAIPFYPKRCSICKSTAVSATPPGTALASGGAAAPARLADIEQRLRLTEGELEATNLELERTRTERDFYRELLGDPADRKREQPGGR